MERSPPYQHQAERLIRESELEAIVDRLVREKLAEMLGVAATTQPQRQWYDAELAYPLLGLNSAEQIRDMVRNEMLRIGIEVRDVRSPNSQLPRYQFHIERCEARLLERPEKRRGKKTA